MKPIVLEGIDASITDMYLGIADDLEEGNLNRYELSALPQNKLSAIGTSMFIDVKFGPGFPVGEGMVMEFQYDSTSSTQQFGVDRTPQKRGESFTIKPPYFSQSIKRMGEHILFVKVSRKYKIAGVIPRIEPVGVTEVPYTIVPPAQSND